MSWKDESVRGSELLHRVLKDGKYGEKKAARTMKQHLEGVAYLHSIGETHEISRSSAARLPKL